MLPGYSPTTQALLGTLFTWGLTLAGAGMALFLRGNQRKMLDTSLGFAAGVMLAASYWSLLEPALEMASGMEMYGEEGEWAFIPVSVGLFLGAGFVWAADIVISSLGVVSPLQLVDKTRDRDSESPAPSQYDHQYSSDPFNNIVSSSNGELRQRHKHEYSPDVSFDQEDDEKEREKVKNLTLTKHK